MDYDPFHIPRDMQGVPHSDYEHMGEVRRKTMTRADIIKEVAPYIPAEVIDLANMVPAVEGTLARYGTIAPASLEHFVVGCYVEALEDFVRKMCASIP